MGTCVIVFINIKPLHANTTVCSYCICIIICIGWNGIMVDPKQSCAAETMLLHVQLSKEQYNMGIYTYGCYINL